MSGYTLIEELIHENKKLKQDNFELRMRLREAEAILKDILKNGLEITK